jgi:hypothetical protein
MPLRTAAHDSGLWRGANPVQIVDFHRLIYHPLWSALCVSWFFIGKTHKLTFVVKLCPEPFNYEAWAMSRLTIDVTEQQQTLNALAALEGKTLRQYAFERLFSAKGGGVPEKPGHTLFDPRGLSHGAKPDQIKALRRAAAVVDGLNNSRVSCLITKAH